MKRLIVLFIVMLSIIACGSNKDEGTSIKGIDPVVVKKTVHLILENHVVSVESSDHYQIVDLRKISYAAMEKTDRGYSIKLYFHEGNPNWVRIFFDYDEKRWRKTATYLTQRIGYDNVEDIEEE